MWRLALATRSVVLPLALFLAGTIFGPRLIAAAFQSSPPTQLTFASEAGVIFTIVRSDLALEYEAVTRKAREALEKGFSDQRKQQAAGWLFYKAFEPGPNGEVVYVSFLRPTVKEADYYLFKIIAEVFPSDAKTLYKTASTAFVSIHKLNLEKTAEFK